MPGSETLRHRSSLQGASHGSALSIRAGPGRRCSGRPDSPSRRTRRPMAESSSAARGGSSVTTCASPRPIERPGGPNRSIPGRSATGPDGGNRADASLQRRLEVKAARAADHATKNSAPRQSREALYSPRANQPGALAPASAHQKIRPRVRNDVGGSKPPPPRPAGPASPAQESRRPARGRCRHGSGRYRTARRAFRSRRRWHRRCSSRRPC